MSPDEIIAVTDKIKADDIELAYKAHVFPWPFDGEDFIPWVRPKKRGLLFFKDFHVSKSLQKELKKKTFKVTFCQNFVEVIRQCSAVKRKNQKGTWITDKIIEAYIELFKRERAYSVEVWAEERLVGGLYGVISDRYLSGESMFFLESGASKLALVKLVEKLESLGLSYLDTQMVTPLLRSFGAVEIEEKSFLKLTEEGILIERDFWRRLKNGK